jgi:hypothetical protein
MDKYFNYFPNNVSWDAGRYWCYFETNLHAFGYDPDFIGDLSFAQPDGKIRFLKYLIL